MTECQKADQTKSRKVTRNAVYNNNEQLNIHQRGMHNKLIYDYMMSFLAGSREQHAGELAIAATAAAIAINVLIHAEKSWQPHTPLQSFCSLAQACPRPRPRACCATLLLCFGWESPMHTWTVCGSPGWGKVPVCCSCAVLHAGPRCAAKHQRRQPWMQHNVCYGRPMLYHIDPRT